VRTATVRAFGDCRVLEITADGFRDLVLANPAILERVTTEVSRRRGELELARTAPVPGPAPEPATSLVARVRRFLLGGAATV
jgi:CRP-like cAMP-binding protein